MNITAIQREALIRLAASVVEAVAATGSQGLPGGHLYAVLMSQGCSLSQFEALMRALISTGKVTKRGELYFATGEKP